MKKIKLQRSNIPFATIENKKMGLQVVV